MQTAILCLTAAALSSFWTWFLMRRVDAPWKVNIDIAAELSEALMRRNEVEAMRYQDERARLLNTIVSMKMPRAGKVVVTGPPQQAQGRFWAPDEDGTNGRSEIDENTVMPGEH